MFAIKRTKGSNVARFAGANNSLDALLPEFWAANGLRVFRENLVFPALFSMDYNSEIAKAGKVVHVRKRGELYARRKLAGTDVTASSLSSVGQLIRLNQQPYVHYEVDDIEQATSLGDVVNDYIDPAFFALARYINEAGAMMCYDFFRNQAGGDTVNGVRYADLVAARKKLNSLKVPQSERPLIVNNNAEATLLLEDKLTRADATGDGTPLQTGIIGRGAGFSIVPSLTLPDEINLVTPAHDDGAVDNSAGYEAGTDVLTVDGYAGVTLIEGTFVIIEVGASGSGKYSVHQITDVLVTSTNTVGITIVPALPFPVLDNALIRNYTKGTVSVAHDEQYAGLVRVVAPSGTVMAKGMGISFAADGPCYGIMEATLVSGTTYDLELNRPLDEAITTSDPAAIFPPVPISWSMTRDAVTMVSRGLRIPKGAATGAFTDYDGIGIRVVMGYDMKAQEELVTVDTLFGLKTLDRDKGMIVIG